MIKNARSILERSSSVFVLTGAGISAESGVPTFRGGGTSLTWRGMPFEVLSSAQMVGRDLPLVWEWFDYRRDLVSKCEPNAGHLALAGAAESVRFERFALVTQNIDGLHARAAEHAVQRRREPPRQSRQKTSGLPPLLRKEGSFKKRAGPNNLVELHGNIYEARCLGCGAIADLKTMPDEERPPVCPECSDSMRPNVVLFVEMLPIGAFERARAAAEACDVCLVVGTSALVAPANMLPEVAKTAGAHVIEVNPEVTALTGLADVSIRGTAAGVLPKILNAENAEIVK